SPVAGGGGDRRPAGRPHTAAAGRHVPDRSAESRRSDGYRLAVGRHRRDPAGPRPPHPASARLRAGVVPSPPRPGHSGGSAVGRAGRPSVPHRRDHCTATTLNSITGVAAEGGVDELAEGPDQVFGVGDLLAEAPRDVLPFPPPQVLVSGPGCPG